MQFTEYEMTTALHGLCKDYLAAMEPIDPKSGEARWATVSRYDRFQMVSQLSSFVLPVFTALPDLTVAPGQRATFTPEQVLATAQQTARDDVEAGRVASHALDAMANARADMTTKALALLPVRPAVSPEDMDGTLDGFFVPDTLEGL